MATWIRGRDPILIEDDELPELGVTFATLAEDQVIVRFAKHLPADRKRYVDAGAYHPVKNSNTLLLHKRGWTGINIDANPEAIASFNKKRPGDINIHAYLAEQPKQLQYAEYDSVTTNRLIAPGASSKSYKGESPLRTQAVVTQSLGAILDQHLGPQDRIGYLNVDCEGMDLNVLAGSNIARWRPSIISIESNTDEEQQAAKKYLENHGYELRATVIVTQIFTDRSCPIMSKALRYSIPEE